jgi:hypothetical protein
LLSSLWLRDSNACKRFLFCGDSAVTCRPFGVSGGALNSTKSGSLFPVSDFAGRIFLVWFAANADFRTTVWFAAVTGPREWYLTRLRECHH